MTQVYFFHIRLYAMTWRSVAASLPALMLASSSFSAAAATALASKNLRPAASFSSIHICTTTFYTRQVPVHFRCIHTPYTLQYIVIRIHAAGSLPPPPPPESQHHINRNFPAVRTDSVRRIKTLLCGWWGWIGLNCKFKNCDKRTWNDYYYFWFLKLGHAPDFLSI